MFCSNCGNKIGDGEKFCDQCGTKVDDIVEETQNISEEATQGSVNKIPTQEPSSKEKVSFDIPASSAQSIPKQQPNPKKKSSTGKVVIIVVIIGLLLLLCCLGSCVAGVFYAINNGVSYNQAMYDYLDGLESDYDIANEDFDTSDEYEDESLYMETESQYEESYEDDSELAAIDESFDDFYQYDVSDYFIFPNSDTEYLTLEDFAGLNADQLRIARNEIYARHGRKFNDELIQAYFNEMPWYVGIIEADAFNEDYLNAIEKKNLEFIVEMEAKIK